MATTFNPADLSGVTLSGGNLTATDTGGVSTDGVRSTTSASGKVAFRGSGFVGFTTGMTVVGVSKSGADYGGADANGFLLLYAAGTGYIAFSNGAVVGSADTTSAAPTSSSVVTVLVDATGGKLYFQCDGNNLFGGNPVAGTGGISIGTGPWFASTAFSSVSSATTADFSPASLPSGFSGWDAATPVNITGTVGATVPQPTTAIVATETPVWSLVGLSTVQFNGATTSFALPLPSGTQQNDIIVVDIATRGTIVWTNAAFQNPQSDAGGNITNGTTASDTSIQSFYCFQGASAPSMAFTRTGTPTSMRAAGTVRAYRSNRSGAPTFDVSNIFAQTTAGTALAGGGITTAQADELLTGAVFLARGATTNNASAFKATTGATGTSGAIDTTTNPVTNTWTERQDAGSLTSPTVAIATYDTVMGTAGATGNITATAASSALNGLTVMAFQHPSAGTGSISGVLAVTEAPDAVAITATTGVSAALATTEGADTVAMAANVGTSGVLAVTEAADTVAITATTGTGGALAVTESPDVVAITANAGTSGALAVTEAPDTVAITVAMPVVGALATTESPDVPNFTIGNIFTANLAATEAPDVVAITATTGVRAALAVTEAPDAVAVNGTIGLRGALAITEAPDVVAITATTGLSGVLATTEAPDVPSFTVANGVLNAVLAVTEAPDTVSIAVAMPVVGVLNVTESPDVVAFTTPLPTGGTSRGKGKTGFEPVKKRFRAPKPEPKPAPLPLPPIPARPARVAPRRPAPVLIPDEIMPDVSALIAQMRTVEHDARDISDIRAFHDSYAQDEQDAHDIAEILAFLDAQEAA
jgi:hypothetical protein